MNERAVVYTHNTIIGALGANLVWTFMIPYGLTLIHVSAVGLNAHNATIMIGDSGDTDQAMTAQDIGDSSVPAEYEGSDFDGASNHFVDGDVITVTVDYDGAGGTAIQGMQLALTFLVG